MRSFYICTVFLTLYLELYVEKNLEQNYLRILKFY